MSTENSPVICAVEEGVVTATILVSQIRDPLVVDSLRTSILQAIDASDARSVIIDFSNLKLMVSMALLAFLAVRRRIGGGRVVFCEMRPEIIEILDICRLIPRGNVTTAPFEIAQSIKDARERCGLA